MSDQLDRLDAMLAKSLNEARRLRDEGNIEQAKELHNRVILPLNELRPKIVLGDIANVAQELNRLSQILESAERDLARDLDSFFLNELIRGRKEVDHAEARIGATLRNGRALDPPSAAAPSMGSEETAPATAPAEAVPIPVPSTKAEYEKAYREMAIRPVWVESADRIADLIIAPESAERYRDVERRTGVPWWFVGVLHCLESSFSFRRHLHNGDPLDAQTVNVPAGRPAIWAPGMRWEESATDALTGGGGLSGLDDQSLGAILRAAESWNGLGYRRRGLFSPYLWSGSVYYEKGKFVRDGVFDSEAVSRQVGAAVIIKRMEQRSLLGISRSGRSVRPKASAQAGSAAMVEIDTSPFPHAEAELRFRKNIEHGMGGAGDTKERQMAVQRVQEWCSYHGIHTTVDGEFGNATRRAVSRFQARVSLQPTGVVDQQTWILLTRPMREALRSRPLRASLNEMLLDVAHGHIAQRPIEIGGNNKGPWVRLYMAGRDGEDQLWCAGFVCTLVAQASRDLKIDMPFKPQVGVDALVRDARDSGRFIAESDLGEPILRPSQVPAGSLFVVRSKSNASDWTHVGIVSQARQEEFSTIEGNTNGSNRDGANARASMRSYSQRDFIRLI